MYIIILSLTLILSSCTGSRYSSESILKDVSFDNIHSLEVKYYYSKRYVDSDTSYNEFVSQDIINEPITIDLTVSSTEYLKEKIKNILNSIPDSREKPYSIEELIAFKKDYLKKNKIDTLSVDSIYNMPRKIRATRNIESYRYKLILKFYEENEESLIIWKSKDNIFNYGFCCTDYKNSWFYRTIKGYSAYSTEYILDIEFQKRFIEMFNSILSYYNKQNGTNYPLLDVDYEIWSGIISDY